MHPECIRQLQAGRLGEGPVIYQMGREQRVKDNWAMIFAQQKVLELQVTLLSFAWFLHFWRLPGDNVLGKN